MLNLYLRIQWTSNTCKLTFYCKSFTHLSSLWSVSVCNIMYVKYLSSLENFLKSNLDLHNGLSLMCSELNGLNWNSGVVIAGRRYGVDPLYLQFYYIPTKLFMVSFNSVDHYVTEWSVQLNIFMVHKYCRPINKNSHGEQTHSELVSDTVLLICDNQILC